MRSSRKNQSEKGLHAARNMRNQYPSQVHEQMESTALAAATSSDEQLPRRKSVCHSGQRHQPASSCKIAQDHPRSKIILRGQQRRPFAWREDRELRRAKHAPCPILLSRRPANQFLQSARFAESNLPEEENEFRAFPSAQIFPSRRIHPVTFH